MGDDLFVTNPARLEQGIRSRSANAVLVKPNQIGIPVRNHPDSTAQRSSTATAPSSPTARETEDTSIADIAVALNAGQIKTGAPARTDRVCKYNRLLKIRANARHGGGVRPLLTLGVSVLLQLVPIYGILVAIEQKRMGRNAYDQEERVHRIYDERRRAPLWGVSDQERPPNPVFHQHRQL